VPWEQVVFLFSFSIFLVTNPLVLFSIVFLKKIGSLVLLLAHFNLLTSISTPLILFLASPTLFGVLASL
jgi:hypothetical protein